MEKLLEKMGEHWFWALIGGFICLFLIGLLSVWYERAKGRTNSILESLLKSTNRIVVTLFFGGFFVCCVLALLGAITYSKWSILWRAAWVIGLSFASLFFLAGVIEAWEDVYEDVRNRYRARKGSIQNAP